MKYPWNERAMTVFREMWDRGDTYETIGERLGMQAKSVGPAARRFNFPERSRKGSAKMKPVENHA